MDLTELHIHWRASTYKGKTYRSYSLARAYRENGKNRRHIVIKLGKISETAAQKWRFFLKAIKNPDAILTTMDNIYVSQHHSYLDVATANAVWDEWKLDTAFTGKGKRTVAISTLARILTVNRCIDPTAKSQTPEWFYSTALPWLLGLHSNSETINTSRIFRELASIEQDKEQVCQHLFTTMVKRDSDSMKSIFYDLSSTTFSGSRCVLMKWGHCKEGYQNHVVLALVVNRDGLPFYWEVLPGGTADSKTIVWLLSRLEKRFKLPQSTLVFDRGMVSDDNLAEIETAEIKYISAMDKNQLETITDSNFTLFKHLNPENVNEQIKKMSDFTKLDNNDTWYREIKVENKRRYILCFNPQLFQDQHKARKQAITDFHAFVDNLNTELLEAVNSRQHKTTYDKFKKRLGKVKLQSFVDVELSKTYLKKKNQDSPILTYQATVIFDDVARCNASRLDGFWLLVTNHINKNKNGQFAISAEETINPYREKVIIESAFRDIKSFIEIKPVYVWTPLHVKAHYTCCVLSYLINRTLTMRLHENKGKETKETFTHEKLYKKLSSCQIDRIEVENIDLATYNMTRPTNMQKELIQRIGLPDLLTDLVIKKARKLG